MEPGILEYDSSPVGPLANVQVSTWITKHKNMLQIKVSAKSSNA